MDFQSSLRAVFASAASIVGATNAAPQVHVQQASVVQASATTHHKYTSYDEIAKATEDLTRRMGKQGIFLQMSGVDRYSTDKLPPAQRNEKYLEALLKSASGEKIAPLGRGEDAPEAEGKNAKINGFVKEIQALQRDNSAVVPEISERAPKVHRPLITPGQ